MEQNSSRLPFILVGGLLIVVLSAWAGLIFTVGAPPVIPTATVPPTATTVPTSVPPPTVDANAQVSENSPQGICNAQEPGELTEQSYPEPEQVLEEGMLITMPLCVRMWVLSSSIYTKTSHRLPSTTLSSSHKMAITMVRPSTASSKISWRKVATPQHPAAGGPGYQFIDEFVGFLTFDRSGIIGDGKCWTRHEWFTILYHHCAHGTSQLPAYHFWRGIEWLRECDDASPARPQH